LGYCNWRYGKELKNLINELLIVGMIIGLCMIIGLFIIPFGIGLYLDGLDSDSKQKYPQIYYIATGGVVDQTQNLFLDKGTIISDINSTGATVKFCNDERTNLPCYIKYINKPLIQKMAFAEHYINGAGGGVGHGCIIFIDGLTEDGLTYEQVINKTKLHEFKNSTMEISYTFGSLKEVGKGVWC
jgi:hypothetical protein